MGVYGLITGFSISGPLYLVIKAAVYHHQYHLQRHNGLNQPTSDIEARDTVLLRQMEAELLGVVVDLLHAVEHQTHEALLSASETFDRRNTSTGCCWDGLLFFFRGWCSLGFLRLVGAVLVAAAGEVVVASSSGADC